MEQKRNGAADATPLLIGYRSKTLLVQQARRRLAAGLAGRGRRPTRGGRRRLVAIGHEAIELFLVLAGGAFGGIVVERATHLVELAALFGKPLQLLLAPVVESDVAGARGT